MTEKRQVHKIQEGKHWFVAGKTGTGKTKLIKHIVNGKVTINPLLNVYNLDTKKRGDFTSADGIMHTSDIAPDAYTTTGHRMVWQPPTDDKEQFSRFFMNILNAGLPAVVVIDECINMRFGDSIPRGLSILLAQGRLPGIHVIGGTQEVARSPRQLGSQATYIISFNLLNAYDVTSMIKILGLSTKMKRLDLKKYQFYLLDTDSGNTAMKINSYQDIPRKYL